MSDHLSRKLAGLNGYRGNNARANAAETSIGDHWTTMPAATRRRGSVSIVTPLHYTHSYRYPLLIWLHSGGHNEHQIEQVLPHISVRNYAAVGIRGTRASDVQGHRFDWPPSRSNTAAAMDAIDEAVQLAGGSLNIHPDRLILAGYRSGGTMAARVAMMCPERFAGVVCMGGRMPSGRNVLGDFDKLRKRRLPMLWQQAVNGIDDDPDRLRADLQMAQSIRARVDVRQYRQDEVMNTVALNDIDRWCFDRIISPRSIDENDNLHASSMEDHQFVAFSAN